MFASWDAVLALGTLAGLGTFSGLGSTGTPLDGAGRGGVTPTEVPVPWLDVSNVGVRKLVGIVATGLSLRKKKHPVQVVYKTYTTLLNIKSDV